MSRTPAISVLLPVRDAAPWLAGALRSLARQSLTDFEVVAVDDGSRDDSGNLLERAAAREPRLRVIHTPARGLPAALNLALERSRAPWVARMDADDLIARRRFELQSAYLESHPEVAVIGSRVRLFPRGAYGPGMARWVKWHNELLDHEAMAREVLIDSPLVHGTALIRRKWLDRVGGWTSRSWPEDLDLWIRLLDHGARFAKCPETLYAWRQHPTSATRRDPRYELERFHELKLDALARRLIRETDAPTVLGVGKSLERWRALLAGRWPKTRAIEIRTPPADVRGLANPPIVLVLVAYQRRDVWRLAMDESGLVEGIDFAFVA